MPHLRKVPALAAINPHTLTISIKLKSSIQTQLDKIKKDTFQEGDIKMLLIDIRELIREETLLRELADFIAHPNRDKGIFNKTLNVRYLKFKLIKEQSEKLDVSQQKKIKTERQLSDFLLSGVNIQKVEKRLFEILFIEGLRDIDDKLFKDHYPISKKHVQKLLSESYQLDSNKRFYELRNLKSFTVIEDVLKFIRGTIEGRPVFHQQTFEKEISKAINRIITSLGFDKTFMIAIKRNLRPILLCILCLLHDAKFSFHDGHIGTCFLSLYPNNELSISGTASGESLIALVSDDIGVHLPIFVSNIKAKNYLPIDEKELGQYSHMQRIPWISATRSSENKLVLTA